MADPQKLTDQTITDHKKRFIVKLQYLAFIPLWLTVVALLAWVSTRYSFQLDWTANQRNTLSETSQELLETISGSVRITAFATQQPLLRKQIGELVARYQRVKKDVTLEFVDPDAEPQRTKQAGITADGELVVDYQGRSQKATQLNEQSLTNAIVGVLRQGEQWIVFLQGHGERLPTGEGREDFKDFTAQLEAKGFKVQTLTLASHAQIPENTAALVLASPKSALLAGEMTLLQDYINKGGNLLWLTEPENARNFAPLTNMLNIQFLPGTVVDATTQLVGVENPSFAIVPEYPAHPITKDFRSLTVFPQAVALKQVKESEEWDAQPFLSTLAQSWNETGPIEGNISPDPQAEEETGPLHLGFALTRHHSEASSSKDARKPGEKEKTNQEQRVVIIGDGDFLTNSYLGNPGNLDLGLSVFQWLTHNDALISIRAKTAPDTTLNLSPQASLGISVGFLFLIPLGLIATGIMIWHKRRKG